MSDTLLCDRGIYATFRNVETNREEMVSRLCERLMGHDGPHMTADGFQWEDTSE